MKTKKTKPQRSSSSSAPQGTMAGTSPPVAPPISSPAPESAQPAQAGPADPAAPAKTERRLTVTQAIEAARNGDMDAKRALSSLLDRRPDLVQRYGNTAHGLQIAWAERLSGGDFLITDATMRRAEAMKKDLAGPDADPMERLQIDRIVALWLQVEFADYAASIPTESLKVSQLRIRMQESANRRLLSAIKTLAVHRRLNRGVRIELHHTGNEPQPESPRMVAPRLAAAMAAPEDPRMPDPADQLDRLFDQVCPAGKEEAMV